MSQYSQAYFEQNQQLGDRPALRWYARVCNRLLGRPNGDIFEYGCGTGWLMHHLMKRHHVTGYDASEFCLEQARQNAPQATICADLAQLQPGSSDLIVSLHTLEHVPEPSASISFLADLLRPGGRLLFVVPAVNGLGHKLRRKEWFGYRDKTHISLLDEAEWRGAVDRAGLRIVQEAGDGLWDPPYVRWLPRWLQLAIFGAPAAIQVWLAGGRLIMPSAWGECLILVSQKPNSP